MMFRHQRSLRSEEICECLFVCRGADSYCLTTNCNIIFHIISKHMVSSWSC